MAYSLKLIKKIPETPDVVSFQLEPAEKIDWQAGQFMRYQLKQEAADERGENRYFTISSAPSENHLMISTKIFAKSSSFKQTLNSLQIGDTIEATGPGGNFTYPDPNQEAIFIAGGIGITPFRSILVDLDAKNLNSKITLFYANRTPDIPFKGLFDTLVAKHSNLKIIYVVDNPSADWTGETGKIDQDLLQKYFPQLASGKQFIYVSGPEPMVQAFGKMLQDMAISKERFKQDFFPGYQEI